MSEPGDERIAEVEAAAGLSEAVPGVAERTQREPELIGREPELAAVRGFLAGLAAGPAALVIHGPMGIGKSALLRVAILMAAAAGVRVLLTAPETPELALPFSGLYDMVEPVLDVASEVLPEPQARALGVATLRLSPDLAPVGSLAVAVGLLGLIRSLAARSPVLIAIDDVQWLDPSSAGALRFVVRRLRDAHVGWLVTQRSERAFEPPVLLARAPDLPAASLPLGPLSDESMLTALRARPEPALSARQTRRVVEAAGGNPLFAAELRRTVAHQPDHPGAPPIAVPGSLQMALDQRLAALDRAATEALATVAAITHPGPTVLDRLIGAQAVARLDPAFADGILLRSGDRIRFAHPMLRSAAYYRVPVADRAAIHRRLADAVEDPVERAWHTVAGVAGPDASAARRIARGADVARRRAAPGDAAELYLAAVARATSSLVRSRRTWSGSAADCLIEAGDHERAEQLLQELAGQTGPGPGRAGLLLRLAALRYRREDPQAAIEILGAASAEATDDARVASSVEQELALALTMSGRLEEAAGCARRAVEHAAGSGDPAAESGALAFLVMIDFIRGLGVHEPLLARALELEAPASPRLIEWRPSMIAALIAAWTGDLDTAGRRLEQLHHGAQADGEDDAITYLLYARCQVELQIGRWDEARALATVGRTYLAEAEGLMRVLLGASVARVEASSGHIDDAVALAEDGLRLSMERRYGPGIQDNASVLGFAALSSRDPHRAIEVLQPIPTFLEQAGVRDPGLRSCIPDLVEALVAVGRLEAADVVLRPFEADADRLERASARPLAARARALIELASGDLEPALVTIHRAVDLHDGFPAPFERARALLVLGRIHRRRREKRAAADVLDEAVGTFGRLGSPGWAAMARDERAMVGLRPPAPAELSPTEQRVAELAAQGLTTREIAAAAYLSPKGVEKAIVRIYRKLGLSSRAQLGARMADRTPPAGPEDPAA